MVRPHQHLVFLAFGTWGDILPLASLACAAADSGPEVVVSFASHAAHSALLQDVFQDRCIQLKLIESEPVIPVQTGKLPVLEGTEVGFQASVAPLPASVVGCLSQSKRRRINFIGAGEAPPPIAAAGGQAADSLFGLQATGAAQNPLSNKRLQTWLLRNEEVGQAASEETGVRKAIGLDGAADEVAAMKKRQQDQCLDSVRQALCARKPGDSALLVFNLFALEGFHLAQHFGMPCLAASPYLIPYGPPQGFQGAFRRRWPALYNKLQAASFPNVGWAEVEHWMWPLFDDARWGHFRESTLQLPRCPLSEETLPSAPPLLYGFSSAVVPCPGYWPYSVHACGFWPPPASWDHGVQQQTEAILSRYIAGCRKANRPLVYIGFGAVGSMGLLPPASALLSTLLAALETAGMAGVLVTSSSPALKAESLLRQDLPETDAIASAQSSEPASLETGVLLGGGRLLCLRGPLSHPWLFPQCALVLHHAGSGTTAAALQAGVPQVTCPFIFDQFYWAGLLTSLGCSPPQLSAADLGQAGRPLAATFLSAVSLQPVAQEIARDIRKEDGVAAALRHLIPEP